MPTKVLPSVDAFRQFRESLVNRGFREILRIEFERDFERLRLEPPSPREGREVGFRFDANGLTVVVWTTVLASQGVARESDAGWVLIKEGDKAKYFTRPMHRTKNFLRRILLYACIARARVLARPNCPQCDAQMRITYGRGHKARFWKCGNWKKHKKPEFLSWDHGLSPEAIDFLREERKRRARYREKVRAIGAKVGAAQQRRKRWHVGQPENSVSPR